MVEPSDEQEARTSEELWVRDILLLRSWLKGPPHADDRGGYMLVDVDANNVIAGARLQLDIDDVERWAYAGNT